jgi:hypothetical protein
MGVLLLFLFGVSGELLAGLGASRPVVGGTASLLGPRLTRLLVATLVFTATLLGGLLFLAAAQTHLSPFDWHEYRIDLAGGQIKVLIDGAEYLRFEGRVPGGLVKVSNTSPRGAFWFAWIAEAKSLPLIG